MNVMQHSFVVVGLFEQNNTSKLIVVCRLGNKSRPLGFFTLDSYVLTVTLLSVFLYNGFLSIF